MATSALASILRGSLRSHLRMTPLFGAADMIQTLAPSFDLPHTPQHRGAAHAGGIPVPGRDDAGRTNIGEYPPRDLDRQPRVKLGEIGHAAAEHDHVGVE